MHHSSLVLFCDECGLANDPSAGQCAACQHPLAHLSGMLATSPAVPITIASPPVCEVTPGPLFARDAQGAYMPPDPSLICDFQPGSLLAGHYQIQEEIGRGGFSVVYRAVDLDAHAREVAIKRIQLNMLTPRQVIDATETFNREITMLARFSNVEGIPTFYEHLTDGENWCLITQYIKGQTLEDALQKAPGGYLNEHAVIALGVKLTELIQKLHTMEPQVIFRDLKPANIMLTPDEGVFLIDFGIARTFTPGKAKDTTPLGSPGYAPPEQYGRGQTDQRSDIYSLGATLQTLLTGRDLLELRAGAPSLNPNVPSRRLRKLLDEMLSPEVAQRPTDILQVKKRLEFLKHRPVATSMMGIVFGAVFCICAQVPPFALFGFSSKYWMSYVALFVAALVESLVRTKFKLPEITPKGFWRFWWLGVLTGVLSFILGAWLWQIFFGLFF